MRKTKNIREVDFLELYDLDAERAMLGRIIEMPERKETIYELQKHVTPADFYNTFHGKVFETMIKLAKTGNEINIVTLQDDLAAVSETIFSDIFALQQAGWTIRDPIHLAKRIREYSIKRQLEEFIFKKHGEMETTSAVDIVSKMGVEIANIYSKTNTENASVKDIIRRIEDQQIATIERFKQGARFIGMPCGIEKIDKALSGIRRYFYYLVNAYTSVGKTMFSLNIANNVLSQGKRVVFFSLEMSQEDIVSRILSIRSGINSISIAMGSHVDDEKEIQAKGEVYDMDLQVYSQKRTLDEITISMISENLKKPVDLFVIDYLQHIRVKNSKSRYDQYTDASNEIQRIVGELGVPVMVLSQIDNISARSKQTDVIATKGSGDVPADADVVILLQNDKPRQECYQDGFKAINAIIQKNRHGITGNMELILETRCGRFHEAERYSDITR